MAPWLAAKLRIVVLPRVVEDAVARLLPFDLHGSSMLLLSRNFHETFFTIYIYTHTLVFMLIYIYMYLFFIMQTIHTYFSGTGRTLSCAESGPCSVA